MVDGRRLREPMSGYNPDEMDGERAAEYRRELNTAALFSAGHRYADRRKIAMLTDCCVHAYVCMR